ncbi:hypothetical protein CEP54_007889 [Fusarium duplospermum]|uniref:Uncharacterized protein n=1 Tax=Fusarium duplospermum TaxID=1325734 RepID=A0A428PZ03_9HYPO|nr:hypothetical protein CEP54_007889 [Fusarium duplospermum]
MPERRPPTPATGDDSFSLGPTKKTFNAEFCTLVHLEAQTYAGGPSLTHNLWFHEKWSAFEAPMNILFFEWDRKPMVFILPHAPEGTPKNTYNCQGTMKFYGPTPQRPDRKPAYPSSQGNSHYADAGRPSFFRASTHRAREMVNSIRLPTFRFPPARWWRHKVMLLLKTLLILVATTLVIALGFELVSHAPKLREIISHAPKLREIIAAKFTPVSQARSHTDLLNTSTDQFNSQKNFFDPDGDRFDGDTHSLKTDRGRPKAAKDYSKTEKSDIKTDKGHPRSERDNLKKGNGRIKFDRNADGNHARGSWTKPDDTHVTFEASKTSGGDVTEVKFVQSEEQFIKDENDTVLFSVNRITRFLVTLIGGDRHDEKLDKIMNGIGSMPPQGNKKVRSRWWW